MNITMNTAASGPSRRSTHSSPSTLLAGRMIASLILAITCGALFSATAAHASVVTLTGDASVNTAHATTNYGTLANLFVGNGNSAYLQFDLTDLPAGVTASQIAKATLTVYVNRVNTGGTVSLSPVTSAWSESAVTSATQPTLGAFTTSFNATFPGQYVTLDVTSLVQGWITTPATNNGVALTSSAANILLDSKENDETAHTAHLDVTITSMGATGATGAVGAPGATGAAGP